MVLSSNVRAKRVRLVRVAMSAFALAAMMALPVKYATVAEAKTPGSTYCFHGTCHRVKTLEETRALVGVEQTLYASHYDDCKNDRYNPCGLTSSGERFHADRPDNTASPIYPDGTTLLVWNPETERALVVRVNNAGPYWGNRKLDLSRAAARKLGFEGKGVAKLKVRVIKAPDTKEARYSRNRVYPAVPGDIGEYDSLDEAQTGMAVALALQASAASPLAPVTASNVFTPDDDKDAEPLVAEAPELQARTEQHVAGADGDEDYVRHASLGLTDLTPQSHWRGHPSLPRIASLVSIRRPGQRLLQTTWDGHDFVDANSADEPEQQVVLASAVEDALKRSAASDAAKQNAPKTSPITTGTVEKVATKKVAAKADKKQKAQIAAKLDKPVAVENEAPQKVAVLSEPVKAEPASIEAKKVEAEKPAVSKIARADADEDKSTKRSSKSSRRASAKKRNNYGSRNQQRVAGNSRYRSNDRYERVAQNSGGSWGNDYRPSRTAQQLQSANLRASPFSSM